VIASFRVPWVNFFVSSGFIQWPRIDNKESIVPAYQLLGIFEQAYSQLGNLPITLY
jgi:hypothetical protein